MTASRKAVWEKILEALRSGNYEQGRRVLKQLADGIPKYCCLGVAAEVLGRQFLPTNQIVFADDSITALGYTPIGHETPFVTQLTEKDAEFLGLNENVTEEEHSKLEAKFGMDTLGTSRMSVMMWMNDDVQAGFPAIADVVEEFEWNK